MSRDAIFGAGCGSPSFSEAMVASLFIVEGSIVIRWQRQMTVELFWVVAVREWKGKPSDAARRTWWGWRKRSRIGAKGLDFQPRKWCRARPEASWGSERRERITNHWTLRDSREGYVLKEKVWC
jgi:hypothetical protein